ncbi:MAG TPA: SDR family oxidoreductase [Pseudonocardiaceae bacterium]|nr:SDR family oxidoreductase [Pseudonocardiaceae bacterium]
MDTGLAGKRALVTGGTRGIGRAISLALAAEGATVVVGHRSPSAAADSLATELKAFGDGHVLVAADLTTRDGARQLVDTARDVLGGLDVLVNNLGVDGFVPVATLDDAEWDRVLDHNVRSGFLVTQYSLDLLADGASIVFVSSSAALRGRANGVHYTASKAAVIGMTRALCKDLGPRRIRVNSVAPALTETEPGAGLPPAAVERIVGMTALGRLCQPEDVASAVLFLAGDTARYVSGITLNVDGGL